MPYSKHTNMELLNECYHCIGDLLRPLSKLTRYELRPKAEALRNELRKRTKSVTFITDDASALQVEESDEDLYRRGFDLEAKENDTI